MTDYTAYKAPPITPPTELVRQWSIEAADEHHPTVAYSMVSLLATKAAHWGADQKLEACCKCLEQLEPARDYLATQLRAANPPSLKEQAQQALSRFHCNAHTAASEMVTDFEIIRRALEALSDD